jgi:RND family efflux transporter MFP subunit
MVENQRSIGETAMLKRSIPAFVCAVFLTVSANAAEEEKVTMVGADSVQARSLSQTIPVSGRLVARQSGAVATRINAPVAEILVEVGDEVDTNQVMVRLVSDRLLHQRELRAAELERAEAALETAKAQTRIVTQELARLERLRKSAAFNQARFDDKRLEQTKTQSAVVEAEAAVRKANADLSLAELDLNYSEIRAPYPGTITARQIDLGDFVSIGQTVVTLINADNLEIEADVPSNRLNGIGRGSEIIAQLADGKLIKTTIRAIIPEENPLTRTRAIRFEPSEDISALNLASNQTLTVQIPIGSNRNILSVAKDAVLTRKGNQMVFAIKEGKATPTPVVLGDALGGYFEVKSGLQKGDIVIVRGNERLRPGQSVKAKDLE